MASGYTEDFFYSSTPERNLELPPPYGDFIFRPPTRRPVVKSSKSFKDKKTKNKGKVPPSRMYATVRDPRMAPGHPLIHPDFITPQQFIPKIVPPEPKPVKPARSKSFNNSKKAAEQKSKLQDPPPFMTYRCQSYPPPADKTEDQPVHVFAVPHQVSNHTKQRLGLHDQLFHPPSRIPVGPSSPPYYGTSPELFLLSDGPPVKDNYGSGMYVPSNELENSLTLKEINHTENEILSSQKPKKKKSMVKQILTSLFSSKKSSEQGHAKNERKNKNERTKTARPVTKSKSIEESKEKENGEENNGPQETSGSENPPQTTENSGRISRPSAKVLGQNDKQDQIIQELKKKNSNATREDLDAEEIPDQCHQSKDGSAGRETRASGGEISRKLDNLDTSLTLQEREEQNRMMKSQSVPSDLSKHKSGKSARN